MKHFISFQKKKGLYLVKDKWTGQSNAHLANAVVIELAKHGYVVTEDLHSTLQMQTPEVITEVYNDLCRGLRSVVGENKYTPIYKNFPQSVKNLSQYDFVMNAIFYYWTSGSWVPEAEQDINREFGIEVGKMVPITLLTRTQFENIFYDIIYSGDSISDWDKSVIDWYLINQEVYVDLGKVSFKETKAYLGKSMLDRYPSVATLPVRNATDVLRILAAYSGGDEGLKDNTKFKQLSNFQKKVVLSTLDQCYDLEESFKVYREPWLRVLFYLNPMTAANKGKYPNVAKYAELLRNTPSALKTFNSKVEAMIAKKNIGVFDLLSKRKGVFMRRLNQLVTVFGIEAVDKFVKTNPSFDQLITVYNYFADRATDSTRSTVMAGRGANNVVTYEGLQALPKDMVINIQASVKNAMDSVVRRHKRVYIDRALYYRPIATNNRGSSLSLDGNVIGTIEMLPKNKTVRAYVHWSTSSDIDLSGFIIEKGNNQVIKVGWNGRGDYFSGVTYSGDNTGTYSDNAEYLDVDLKALKNTDAEWIVLDARVYRGPNFKDFSGNVLMGWQIMDNPEKGSHWQPQTIARAVKVNSDSKNCYLSAIHLPTNSIVYLDLAIENAGAVSTNEDLMKIRAFLDKFVISGNDEISWDKIGQGHAIHLLADQVVSSKEDADMVFDENTPWEAVSRLITEQTL